MESLKKLLTDAIEFIEFPQRTECFGNGSGEACDHDGHEKCSRCQLLDRLKARLAQEVE